MTNKQTKAKAENHFHATSSDDLHYISEPLRCHARPLSSLTEDKKNPRKHGRESRLAVMASLKNFGQTLPLVCSKDGVVLVGNNRLAAMRKLGWTHAAVVEWTGSDEALRAYSIADNRTGELSGWHNEELGDLLSQLSTECPNLLGSVGFSQHDINLLLGNFDAGPAVSSDTQVQGVEKTATTAKWATNGLIYEPTGENHSIESLYDRKRYDFIMSQVQKADIPEDIRQFLTLAAGRFVRINFGMVADVYPNQPEKVRKLFELLALVLIDYDKAIENGVIDFYTKIGSAEQR